MSQYFFDFFLFQAQHFFFLPKSWWLQLVSQCLACTMSHVVSFGKWFFFHTTVRSLFLAARKYTEAHTRTRIEERRLRPWCTATSLESRIFMRAFSIVCAHEIETNCSRHHVHRGAAGNLISLTLLPYCSLAVRMHVPMRTFTTRFVPSLESTEWMCKYFSDLFSFTFGIRYVPIQQQTELNASLNTNAGMFVSTWKQDALSFCKKTRLRSHF